MAETSIRIQEIITLKGAVISKFNSVAKFADFVGWSRRKAGDIVSGRQPPTAKDMEVIAEALGVTTAEPFCAIFFPNMCHNVDMQNS